MTSKKIILNELRNLVKQIIKEELTSELKQLGDFISNNGYKFYGETNGVFKYIKILNGKEVSDNEIHISKEVFNPSDKYADPQTKITPYRISFLFGRHQAHPRFKDINTAQEIIKTVLNGETSINSLQKTY